MLGTRHCVLYLFYGRIVDRDVGSLGTAEAFVDLDQRSKADLQIVGLHMLSLVWQTSSYASTTPPIDSIAIFAPPSPGMASSRHSLGYDGMFLVAGGVNLSCSECHPAVARTPLQSWSGGVMERLVVGTRGGHVTNFLSHGISSLLPFIARC